MEKGMDKRFLVCRRLLGMEQSLCSLLRHQSARPFLAPFCRSLRRRCVDFAPMETGRVPHGKPGQLPSLVHERSDLSFPSGTHHQAICQADIPPSLHRIPDPLFSHGSGRRHRHGAFPLYVSCLFCCRSVPSFPATGNTE